VALASIQRDIWACLMCVSCETEVMDSACAIWLVCQL